jgi:hypothetical protein
MKYQNQIRNWKLQYERAEKERKRKERIKTERKEKRKQ